MSNPIGAIKRAILHPCGTGGPELWAETFGPAALKAIWSLFPFDLKHGVHKLSGQSWLKNYSEVLDDAFVEDPIFVQAGVKFLFRFGALLDIATWYMFLADVGIDFALNWSSMTWRLGGCLVDPNHDYVYGYHPFGAMSDFGDWRDVGAWHMSQHNGGGTGAPEIYVPPHAKGSLGVAVRPSPIFGGLVPYQTRIRDVTADTIIASSGWTGSDAFGANDAICNGSFETDDRYHLLVAEYNMPVVNDGHPHVVGFNGGSFSGSWTTTK